MREGRAMDIQSVLGARSHLGETPVWDEEDGVLWWIDIYKPTINRFDPSSGINDELVLDQAVHAIGLRRGGGLVASLQHGFGFVDPWTGAIDLVANPVSRKAAKVNTGKCAEHGRDRSGVKSIDEAVLNG